MLKLQVVCLQRYCKNSVADDFLGILQFFCRIATFENSGQLPQISLEIIVMSLLPLFNFQLRNAGTKHVSKTVPRRFQNFSVCLGNTSAKETVEDSAEISVYYNICLIDQHILVSLCVLVIVAEHIIQR